MTEMTKVGARASIEDFLEHARSVHVFYLRRDGTVEACNDAACRNLGVSTDEIVRQPLQQWLTETDADRLTSELLTPGRRSEPMLLNLTDRDHLPYTLECWLDVHDDGATVIGEPPLKDDQRLQRDLMRLTQDLTVLSRQRARLMEAEARARQEAENANQQKERAIAMLAHELRQPLVPMRFALELLTADVPDSTRERALRSIERQVTQFSRLIEELLDAARIRENKLSLKRMPIDLGSFLRELVEPYRDRAASAGIQFDVVVPGTPVWVSADTTRLAQVFSNLLDNALKFTSRDGRVALTLALEGSMASLSVRDTGRGIDAAVLPRLFEMFAQQGEGERGGLGIGLAVVSGIVKLHGGTIEARSGGIGQGAEFVVRLPVMESPVATSQQLT